MDLKEKFEEQLKASLKAGRKGEVAALRLTLSEIQNAEKDKRRPLEEQEIIGVIRSAVKKRKEAVDLFRKGGREDLVEKESAEQSFLETFLPPALSREDLAALLKEGIAETGAASMRDLGALMKWIMPRLEGRADGAEVSKLAREELSATEESAGGKTE